MAVKLFKNKFCGLYELYFSAPRNADKRNNVCIILWKKDTQNVFRKNKTSHHLQSFLAIPLYSKTNETFNICTCFVLTLFSALQSHLKEVLTSNVSRLYYFTPNSILNKNKNKPLIII